MYKRRVRVTQLWGCYTLHILYPTLLNCTYEVFRLHDSTDVKPRPQTIDWGSLNVVVLEMEYRTAMILCETHHWCAVALIRLARLSCLCDQPFDKILWPFVCYRCRHSHRRGIAFSHAWLFVRLSVCLFVLTVKGKQLELSTPNLAHIYSVAVTRPSACIDPEVKGGQRSRSYLRKPSRSHGC